MQAAAQRRGGAAQRLQRRAQVDRGGGRLRVEHVGGAPARHRQRVFERGDQRRQGRAVAAQPEQPVSRGNPHAHRGVLQRRVERIRRGLIGALQNHQSGDCPEAHRGVGIRPPAQQFAALLRPAPAQIGGVENPFVVVAALADQPQRRAGRAFVQFRFVDQPQVAVFDHPVVELPAHARHHFAMFAGGHQIAHEPGIGGAVVEFLERLAAGGDLALRAAQLAAPRQTVPGPDIARPVDRVLVRKVGQVGEEVALVAEVAGAHRAHQLEAGVEPVAPGHHVRAVAGAGAQHRPAVQVIRHRQAGQRQGGGGEVERGDRLGHYRAGRRRGQVLPAPRKADDQRHVIALLPQPVLGAQHAGAVVGPEHDDGVVP